MPASGLQFETAEIHDAVGVDNMEDSVPDLINDEVSTVQDIVLNLYHDQTHNKRPLSCHLLYIK